MHMRARHLLAPSILAAACFPIVASAQTVVFSQNFDAGTGGGSFTIHDEGDDDFDVDFNYDYGSFQYLRFFDPLTPTPLNIPPAPGGSTTTGVRISVNDVDPGATVAVQLIPNAVNLSGNYRMTFDMWMNYNGPRLGGTGSTETFVAGLNTDGTGVIGPVGVANGYAFTATGEGGATQDYAIFDRGDPIDDGPGYPKVNAFWPTNIEQRFNRETGDLETPVLNDFPHNHFNSYYDTVFPGDPNGGGTFETRGAPGKAWVPVSIEQSDNEVIYTLNGKLMATLFREQAASGVPSLGYADQFNSVANPNIDNFILFDNIVITTFPNTSNFTATSGNYSNAGNWSGGVPNGAGLKAGFSGNSAPSTVTVDVPVTLRSMSFNSPNSYTVAGANTITLAGEQNSFINNGGSHTISVPVVAQGHVATYIAPNSTLTIENLTTDDSRAFGKAGIGSLVVNEIRATALQVTGGTLKLLPGGVNRVNSVEIQNIPAKIDLTTAPIIVDYVLRTVPGDPTMNNSPFNNLTAEILTGYNGGDWLGDGFTSSNAQAAPNNYAVGYLDNSEVGLTTYLGEPVDSDTIIVRGTRRGDANLDGTVNLQDFNALAANFGSTDADWWQGDFANYDRIVNLADFNALAINFGLQAGPDGPTPEDWAALGALVPEPSALGVLCLAALPLVRRRHRRG
jgi:hypothetical protein